MIDDLATFTARLPCWVGRDGLPLSFRHYRYGMDWLNRDDAREALKMASATRAASFTKDGYRDWRRDMMRGT